MLLNEQEIANAAHRMLLRNIVAMLIRLDIVDARQCQFVLDGVIKAVESADTEFDRSVAAYMRRVFNEDIWDKMVLTQNFLKVDEGRKDN